jgi:hypothetical protein
MSSQLCIVDIVSVGNVDKRKIHGIHMTPLSLSHWDVGSVVCEKMIPGGIFVDTCKKMFVELVETGQSRIFAVRSEKVLIEMATAGETEVSMVLLRHLDARDRIISRLQDAIRDKFSKILFPPRRHLIDAAVADVVSVESVEEYVRLNYRLVFFHGNLAQEREREGEGVRENDPTLAKAPTQYGDGAMVSPFEPHTLSSLVCFKTGQVTLSLGLAFEANVLTDPPLLNGFDQRHYQRQGHDCVKITKGDTRPAMVYWQPSAVMCLLLPISASKL